MIDPELHRSIVELDMVRSIDVSANGVVDVTVSLTTPGCPIKGHFQSSVAQAVTALDGVTHVNVYFDVLSDTQKAALQQKLGRGSLPAGALAQVANVLCIGSGKGGVGKSTLTANLAAALTAEGKRVGVLDADVWGYSIPRMYGLGATRPPVSAQRKIVPLESHGVKVMSIGFFVEEDAAVVWRGPMLHKALTQFLQDVEWGALDYLLVDLPPGTGDVSMTLAQLLPQAQFMIVTTPQATAQKVARRSAHMAHKVDLQIGGVIENMSSFTTPSGERFTIFGEGGGQELADELDVPLLGKVPLTMPLREQADSGVPLVIEDPDDPAVPGDPPRRARPHRDDPRAPSSCPCCRSSKSRPGEQAPNRRRAANPWACRCRWPDHGPPPSRHALPATRAVRPEPGSPMRPARKPTRLTSAHHLRGSSSTWQCKTKRSRKRLAAATSDEPVDRGRDRSNSTRAAPRWSACAAEGIEPYPPVSLWDTRTRIADVLAAHDAGELEHGEHPEPELPDRRPADLAPRPRQDRVPRRPRPVRVDPGGRPRRRARPGDIRPHPRPRHRRHRRRSTAASTSPSAASSRWRCRSARC